MFKKLIIAGGLIFALFGVDGCHASLATRFLPIWYVTNTQQGLNKKMVTLSDVYGDRPLVRVLCLSGGVKNQRDYLEYFYQALQRAEQVANLQFLKDHSLAPDPEYLLLSCAYDPTLEEWMLQETPPGIGMAIASAEEKKILEVFPELKEVPTKAALLEFRAGKLYPPKAIVSPTELLQ